MSFGAQLPDVRTPPPGEVSAALSERLAACESRNVTYRSPRFPVFWEEARGANVRDADGNVYVDLTSAFGVALPGHAHPRIVEALRHQSGRLVHAMGDVHPPVVKLRLLERLGALAPWPDARGVLASTGSEAVEIALKTALLATGRPGVLAFRSGYHGLTAGSLAAAGRAYFREPFAARLYGGVELLPWPDARDTGRTDPADAARTSLEALEAALRRGAGASAAPVGAVVLEPVQGRGGVRVPPAGWLRAVAERTRAAGALLVADEILTGSGRCAPFARSVDEDASPDLLCLGKALGGGLPLSACLGPAGVFDAWPASPGEALHTSTFLGHPLACAAALAHLDLLEEGLHGDVARVGGRLAAGLREVLDELRGGDVVVEVRGVAGLVGVAMADGDGAPLSGAGADVAEEALREGLLVLPAGDAGEVVELAPPSVLTDEQLAWSVERLSAVVRRVVEARVGRVRGADAAAADVEEPGW